jgi:hypothetical protein
MGDTEVKSENFVICCLLRKERGVVREGGLFLWGSARRYWTLSERFHTKNTKEE